MPLLLTVETLFFFYEPFPFLFSKGKEPGVIDIHSIRISFTLSRLIGKWLLHNFLPSSKKVASLFEGIFSMFSSGSSLSTVEGIWELIPI
jgi:hypothetical protein